MTLAVWRFTGYAGRAVGATAVRRRFRSSGALAVAITAACATETSVPNVEQGGDRAKSIGLPPEAAAGRAGRGAVDVRAALPAWQAVVERARYLERRGDSGVVQGMVCGAAPPFAWLVDETEGNGSLAIRVLLPRTTNTTSGDRIAVAGAWSLDESRSWYWRATAATALPALAMAKTQDSRSLVSAGRPGCERVNSSLGLAVVAGEIPANARPITLAKQGEVAHFVVVGESPVLDGDGWLVADRPGSPYALLTLPGERSSFGGQDVRSRSERWLLRQGETYWVQIGLIRRRKADKLAIVTARTPPVRAHAAASQTGR